jgi:hypothetical protein
MRQDHRLLTPDEGFAQVPGGELALIAGSRLLTQVQQTLVAYMKERMTMELA